MLYAPVGHRTGEEEEVESELDSDGGKEESADVYVCEISCFVYVWDVGGQCYVWMWEVCAICGMWEVSAMCGMWEVSAMCGMCEIHAVWMWGGHCCVCSTEQQDKGIVYPYFHV